MLGDFFDRGVAQLGLFDEYKPRVNSASLMLVLDKLNRRGESRIYFAGQGLRRQWQMKREMLSPAYTTRLQDLPRVSV
ncbi:DUF4113 domain-containing protein [Acerihabitans sp. KWT182]|uniref:DUF4113 domain-containing protein n=1 Tax=Acerihabitans sp. KWT182 TaxID=3157919 RepID=A0AAU7QAT1_9GAMM